MAAAAETQTRKLRILCIHGYRQNGQTFREKTGSLRKILKKHAECVFITAPHIIPPSPSQSAEQHTDSSEQRGWWFSADNPHTFSASQQSQISIGLDESVEVVKKAFLEKGPFDGILAFSQGAAFVTMLLAMEQENPGLEIRFAILVAGFRSKSSAHCLFYDTLIECPTLHVFGDSDNVIPKEMSLDHLKYFKDPIILEHDGGHFIPTSGPHKNGYIRFLNMFTQNNLLPEHENII